MPAPKSSKSLSLGLQGGGVHAAFTWGVIDQLLADGRIDIKAITASSGGAMIATVLTQGILEGDYNHARERMQTFWKKVSIASGLMPLRMKAVDSFLGHVGVDFSATSLALDTITRIFSPYQFNLFDINPLRGIIDEMVNFDWLAKDKNGPALYINATHVRTGKSKVFKRSNLSLEAVMASCCLPYLFKTVEVDGEPYWDGSFSGCPALAPLVNNQHCPDILVVQIHPSTAPEIPITTSDILDRATEMSFNAVLNQELKSIALYNQAIELGKVDQKPVFIHRIESEEMLASLGRASKLNADWDFIIYLHDLGVQAASDWLEQNYDAIGKNSSYDMDAAA